MQQAGLWRKHVLLLPGPGCCWTVGSFTRVTILFPGGMPWDWCHWSGFTLHFFDLLYKVSHGLSQKSSCFLTLARGCLLACASLWLAKLREVGPLRLAPKIMPDITCQMERQIKMWDRIAQLECHIESQIEWQIKCQIECQIKCQKECHTRCQIDCQRKCQNICPNVCNGGDHAKKVMSKTCWNPMNLAGWAPPVISWFINHYNPYQL